MKPKASILVAPETKTATAVPQKSPTTRSVANREPAAEGSVEHVSNTERATTITIVLENILTHEEYIHGGINE